MAGVCAVVLAKDEADIIGSTVRHLLGQVDHVVVVDNLSTDATAEIAADLGAEVARDSNPAHMQDRKMTAWAHEMRNRGFEWMIPCDADELWYSYDGTTLGSRLGSLGPEIECAIAPVFDHVPTRVDPDEVDPFRRIGWHHRMVSAQWRQKVACRLQDGLTIMMGNHRALLNDRKPRESLALAIRHYPCRSADQYVRKMVNGNRAIALTGYAQEICWHWREVADLSASQLAERFETVEKVSDPHRDTSLVYDPAPVAPGREQWRHQLELSPATPALRALERASSVDGRLAPTELSFLYEVARTMPAGARVVEVGSWEGAKTIAICEGLRSHRDALLYAVDPSAGNPSVRAQHGDSGPAGVSAAFARNTSDYPFVRMMDVASGAAAGELDEQSLDWIFIATNHPYESVVADIFAWAPKLKPDGLMSGYDFGSDGVKDAVQRAFGRVDHMGSCWYTTARPRPRVLVELRRLYSRARA